MHKISKQPWQFRKGYEISHPANLAAPVVDFFLYYFLSLLNLSLCDSDSLLIFW